MPREQPANEEDENGGPDLSEQHLFHGEAHVCAFPKINSHHSATSKVFDTMRTVRGIKTRLRSLGLISLLL